MNSAVSILASAVAIGIGATLFMDLCALLLQRIFNMQASNYCLVGRWLAHMSGGVFRHASIAAAAPKQFECALGWVTHYIVGAGYALIFISLVSGDWIARPTLLPAVIFGVVTVVAPFFVMQPAFGLGIAASRTPRPAQARLKSLVAHLSFGVGLYVSALVASQLLRA